MARIQGRMFLQGARFDNFPIKDILSFANAITYLFLINDMFSPDTNGTTLFMINEIFIYLVKDVFILYSNLIASDPFRHSFYDAVCYDRHLNLFKVTFNVYFRVDIYQ